VNPSILIVTALVYGFMLVEARRAASNELALLARGGVEPRGDVYRAMRVAYPAAFAVMIAELWWRGAPDPGLFLTGLAAFVAAKALKWWAIVSLGPCWTFRVVVMPGTPLVATGPYAFIRHPNYVAVVGELVATMLMTGARFTGLPATLLFGLLMRQRIHVENRALGGILRSPSAPPLDSA
jgi:methyltransferase